MSEEEREKRVLCSLQRVFFSYPSSTTMVEMNKQTTISFSIGFPDDVLDSLAAVPYFRLYSLHFQLQLQLRFHDL